MKYTIDIVEILYKSFKEQKPDNIISCYEKKFTDTLSTEQALLYYNVKLENTYSKNGEERELIKFVLDFVAKLNGQSDVKNIHFD